MDTAVSVVIPKCKLIPCIITVAVEKISLTVLSHSES